MKQWFFAFVLILTFYIPIIGESASYYVNDTNTTGDVYTSAAGVDSPGNGTNAASPMLTLTNLLASYDLEPGDIVYVDTGMYEGYTVFIDPADQGALGNPVIIRGSTNQFGTFFNRDNGSANGFTIETASFVNLEYLGVKNASIGVELDPGDGCELINCFAVSNTAGFAVRSAATNNRYVTGCQTMRNFYEFRTEFGASNVFVRNSTFYGGRGVLVNNGTLSISNSIIWSTASTCYRRNTETTSFIFGDHNIFYTTGSADIAATPSIEFFNLHEYQKSFDTEWRSVWVDPQLQDEMDFDYHLKSAVGRWSGASWVIDASTSPAIDFAASSAPFSNEQSPNGGGANVGAYGNTWQASLSPASKRLMALTCNDGGTLIPDDNPTLADKVYWWASPQYTGGDTVRLEYSNDSGTNWQTVATGLAATLGEYAWTNTTITSSRFSRWRVVDETNPTTFDMVDQDFLFRNGPITYFLNDNSLVDDIYTTAVGDDDNLGTGPVNPKATLSSLLNSHDIEPGDIIYVDTGLYNMTVDQIWSINDSGNAEEPVQLFASTNGIGATFSRFINGSSVLKFSGAEYIRINQLKFKGAINSLFFDGGTHSIDLHQVDTFEASGNGMRIEGGSFSNRFFGVASYKNGDNGILLKDVGDENIFNHCVFYNNTNAAIRTINAATTVSNSVFVALGCSSYAYVLDATSSIVGDYNCFYLDGMGLMSLDVSSSSFADRLPQWIFENGSESNSVSVDPLFANPDNGDFHLKSLGGRYEAGNGWVLDADTSPLLDRAAPTAAYTNETAPNGMRANIGRYGNTWEASRSSLQPLLQLGVLRAGGRLEGTVSVHWIHQNLSTHTVGLYYSTNGGASWTTIATGVAATNGVYAWDTSLISDSPGVLLQIISEQNGALIDQTEKAFSIRNSSSQFDFYVNDGALTGDEFTSAVGSSANDGTTMATPSDSLAYIVDTYDLEPGDHVYVDTGEYLTSSNIVVSRLDSGSEADPLLIAGSTNEVISGTIINRGSVDSGAYALELECLTHAAISNLVLKGASEGLHVNFGDELDFYFVRASENSTGVALNGGGEIRVHRSAISFNTGVGVDLGYTDSVLIEQSVIYTNGGSAIVKEDGILMVSNCVLSAHAPSSFIYDLATEVTVHSDYNNFLSVGQSQVGKLGSVGLLRLDRWQEASGEDTFSLTHDPYFANPLVGDFHPYSEEGRFVHGSGYVAFDAQHSYLIDTGADGWSIGDEPAPNGNRMNIGIYGQTDQASKSRTNDWLLALSFNSGGLARGTNVNLCWVASDGLLAGTVTIELSLDDGATYSNLVAGVNASDGCITFDTSGYKSPIARWRVVSDADPGILDATDSTFIINNGGLIYYVNDSSQVGDVYTFAAGDPLFDGLEPSRPETFHTGYFTKLFVRPGRHDPG